MLLQEAKTVQKRLVIAAVLRNLRKKGLMRETEKVETEEL